MGRRREWCRVGRSQRFDSGPMNQADLSADEQTAILAERYSQRADAYDQLWSPVIRPPGELLISQLSLSAAKRIIDGGTGAGPLLPPISRPPPPAPVLATH